MPESIMCSKTGSTVFLIHPLPQGSGFQRNVKSSENIATALEKNSKIIMLGGGNGQNGAGNALFNLVPMFSLLTEKGMLSLLPEELRPVKKAEIH